MFWVLKGRSKCSYVFVYDDTDKSVEYVAFNDLVELGVDYKVRSMYDNTLPYAKLMMTGFKKSGYDSYFNYCRYMIDDVWVLVELYIRRNVNVGEVNFVFEDFWRRRITLEMYANTSEFIPNEFIMDSKSFSNIKFSVPVLMLPYLMHLRASKDFNGFMRSFGDLMGKRIGLLTPMFRNDCSVNLLYW